MALNLQFLLLSGSVRSPSYTHALTEAIGAALVGHDLSVRHWSLRERPLGIADPEYHDDPRRHPDPRVQDLVRAVEDADGLVLASPVYHNSYSGVLKNALDHLAIPQLRQKPVALAGHGGHRSTQAVDHLRTVVRGLLGVAIPTQVCTEEDDYAPSAGSRLVVSDPRIERRIERLVVELVQFAVVLHPLRSPPARLEAEPVASRGASG